MFRKTLIVMVLLVSIGALAQNPVTADSPFQIRYAANLNLGDSVINISNSGASGGNLCTNVYTFAPDEQLISCCACVVTPNALVSLSVRNDLISNTLTPGVPGSVVIKLLSTSGGTCNAGTASTATISPGLLAWGTTYRATTTTVTKPGQYWWMPSTTTTTTTSYVTESEFTPATLSAFELARMSNLCANIQANGSGFGICRSCRFGGQ